VRELLWQLVPPSGTPREAWCNGGESFVETPFAAPGFIAWEELYWDVFSDGEVWLIEALLDLGLDANQPFGYGDPLTFAFRCGEPLPLLQLLLARGADPKRGETLLEAVESGLESLQLLLDAGADPNVRYEPGVNWNRTALLHLLSEYVWEPEKLACAEALVAKGADVNALDSEGASALDYAEEREDAELIAFLETQRALRGEELKPRRKGRKK
jgi:ankyrin repeat protein